MSVDPCKRHVPGLQTAANIPTVNNSQDSGHMTRLKSVALFPPALSVNEKMEMKGWLDGTSLREKKQQKKQLRSAASFYRRRSAGQHRWVISVSPRSSDGGVWSRPALPEQSQTCQGGRWWMGRLLVSCICDSWCRAACGRTAARSS